MNQRKAKWIRTRAIIRWHYMPDKIRGRIYRVIKGTTYLDPRCLRGVYKNLKREEKGVI